MKISTKGRYALTIMLSIAKGYDKDEYISLNKIAEDEQISVKYLEKIMTSLKKNNLVKIEVSNLTADEVFEEVKKVIK